MDEDAQIVIFDRGPYVSFANCGLPYYVGGVIQERQKLIVTTPARFQGVFNIDVRTDHEVVEIDRDAKAIRVRDLKGGDVSTESYDTLVLSPGAMPVRPPLPGIDLPAVHSLRNIEDMDRIHDAVAREGAKQAVVVGAGYIGLEMVENLRRRGLDVTVLELADQVMPQMDPEMVAAAQHELKRNGVDLRLGNGVAAFEKGPGETLSVRAQDGKRFAADLVILAIGVRPEVTLAQQAGLEIGETGGIRVDEQMRTSDAAIFAVGDAVEVKDFVTGQPALIALAGPANRQGRIVADVICGRDGRFRGSQGSAVVGVFDLTLAMTGATEKTLKRAGMPFERSYTHSLHHAAYYPGAEEMAIKLLFAPGDGRILGAQAVGKAGVEKRIDVLATAIQMGATVFDLEEAELCYAPQYGSARDPVNIAGFVAANILRGDVEPVHWDEWQAAQPIGEQGPLVVDVRPAAMAAKVGEVPGTVNIPISEIRSRLGEFPRDREIWVHCMIGQTSYIASRILKQEGFRVRNLAGGFLSYRQRCGRQ